jgi:hypothetical protein
MKRAYCALILAISLNASGDLKPCARPIWKIDLTSTNQFQDFGQKRYPANQLPPPWTSQQGIEFISSQVLAVYQVLEVDDPQPVGRKDPSGGSGRYQLHVSFLDVTNGKELKSFQLVTSGWLPSRVFPTHDGRFLIRTGETIRSFSPSFDQIAIAHFPHKKTATREWYQVSVSFSGKRIYIHYTASDSSELMGGMAVLDADSLHPVESLPQGDAPSGKGAAGFTFVAKDHSCPSGLTRITPDVSVGFGCKELKLFSFEGQLLWNIPMDEQVVSVRATGVLLAALIQSHSANLLHPDIGPEPLRIDLYDVDAKSEKCSVPATTKPVSGHWPPIFYAVSSSGTVAIVQGNMLSVYSL